MLYDSRRELLFCAYLQHYKTPLSHMDFVVTDVAALLAILTSTTTRDSVREHEKYRSEKP